MSEPDDDLRQLLESAGARPEPPAEDLARIREAFRAEWQEHVRRRAPRVPRFLALAAMVLAAVGVAWWLSSVERGPAARVESVSGVSGLEPGQEIRAGTGLETGPGRAALRLVGGPSLRLDAGTRIGLVSPAEVRLERGAVYLDSRLGDGQVAIHTPLGVVTDVGTRFEVRLLGEGEALRVRVREGEARVAGLSVAAGEEVVLRDGGAVERRRAATYGPGWDWVLAAAPPLAIDGLTLEQLLDRVAREAGWTVEYEDEDLAASAASIQVHGPSGLGPVQALDVVLPAAGLRHRVVDGRLIVGMESASRIPN